MYEMMYELVYVMNACEIYLYFSLSSATDGNGLFAVRRGRQRSHVAANCASWELTHLVSLPTVADGKDFAVRGGRQRTCSLPTVADGKEPGI